MASLLLNQTDHVALVDAVEAKFKLTNGIRGMFSPSSPYQIFASQYFGPVFAWP